MVETRNHDSKPIDDAALGQVTAGASGGGIGAGKVQMQDIHFVSRGSGGDDPMLMGSRRWGDDFGG